MWTRDKVLNYASDPCGLTDYSDDPSPGWARTVGSLETQGLIELRTRTADLPAVADREGPAFVAHYEAFGWPTEAYTVEIKTWHLTEAGRAAWVRGGR